MMAALSENSDLRSQWDNLLRQLNELSLITLQNNSELHQRLGDLEEELSVWKQTRFLTLERQKREHDEQILMLKNRIAALESNQQFDSTILCVINAEEKLFNSSLLSLGEEGGKQAAERLTKGIAEHLLHNQIRPYGRFSFWVYLYLNKQNLYRVVASEGICTAQQLDAFLSGFSRASARFLIVDVEYIGEAADTKIKEFVETYVRFPQTLKIILSGSSRTYLSSMSSLSDDDVRLKLVILKANNEELQNDLKSPNVQSFTVSDLFRSVEHESQLSFIGASSSILPGVASVAGPQSPSRSTPVPTASGALKLIESSLPLHKQTPPPCNEFYLMTCPRGASCKYSHDYILTPEQHRTLAINAKKAPCNFIKSGQPCPYGDKCCWGHVCPKGPSCFHFSKGKCWFKGANMHGENQVSTELP